MQPDERTVRRLKLRELRILLAVAECGSMAKAGKQLAMAQPAISKAIADLEHTLGVRLLDRSPRGVEPTIYGRTLLKRSVGIFDELRQSLKEIEFLADPTAGEVRIGGAEAVTAGLLPVIIERILRKHPRIVLHVTLAESFTLHSRDLRERKIDLVIGRPPMSLSEEEFDSQVLYDEQLYVVAGANSPWARRRRLTLAELVDKPWILVAPESIIGALIAEVFHASGLAIPRASVLTFSLLIRNGLLANGRFLTILPGNVLRFGHNRAFLKALPIKLPVQPQPIGIVTLKNRTLSPAAQLFIDCAHEITRPLASEPPGRSGDKS